MRGRTRALSGLLAAVLSLFVGACGTWPGSGGTADDGLRILVPNTPGGGYDTTARTVARVLEETGSASDMEVFNLPGSRRHRRPAAHRGRTGQRASSPCRWASASSARPMCRARR